MKNKVALVVNAHPDDSEMAMGGTLVMLKSLGYHIVNASLTKGGAGTYSGKEVREKEFLNSQKKIGSTPVLLDFPDTALENTLETRLEVVKLIRKYKPTLVFAPYAKNDRANFDGMMHRDHSIAGIITSEAIKLSRFKGVLPELEPHKIDSLLFYMIPTGTNPTFLFDITNFMDETIDLIKTYDSQVQKTDFLEVLISMRRHHGHIIRVKYAEAFVTEMPILITPENLTGLL